MSAPIPVRHIDLRQPEEPAPGPCAAAYNVFWWGELPLGARMACAEELPFGPGQLHATAVELLAAQLTARDPGLGAPLHATHEGRPVPALTLGLANAFDRPLQRLQVMAEPSTLTAGHISVVICTRDREQALGRCLRSLQHQRSPAGEIVVVDNSATASARAVCAQFPHVIHVHEPRPGLSIARNTGVRAASGEIVAFTDDDVEPHPGWLAEMARAFANAGADAMTGLVLPAELDTPAQQCFQFDMGGFGETFVPVLFDHRFYADTRVHGPQVWKIGAGANMAFRRQAFQRAGLFDERLGAGASGCSEDSELWYRLLALGGACLYEPRAVVFHHHRAQWPALKRQMRVYMRGHVSALVAQADRFGDTANLRRIGVQLPRYFARTAVDCMRHGRRARGAILLQEILGWCAGLRYLLRRNWRRARADLPKA